MTQNTNQTDDDPRTDALKQQMTEYWTEHADEFRDDENFGGSEVLYEDDDLAIVADKTHSNRALHNVVGTSPDDIPTRVLRNWMQSVAEAHTDHDWSDDTALVFDKDN